MDRVVLCLAIMLGITSVESCPSAPEESAGYQVVKFTDDYYLYARTECHEVVFRTCAKSDGWVGFGISPNTGRMLDSDVVIGWINGGNPTAVSGWVGPTTRERPSRQDKNLWKVQDSEEKEGWTSLTYRRPLTAPNGNSKAKSIVVGSNKVIWAFRRDADVNSYEEVFPHEASTRGFATLVLQESKIKDCGKNVSGGRPEAMLALLVSCVLIALRSK